jgi:hypothetical protein
LGETKNIIGDILEDNDTSKVYLGGAQLDDDDDAEDWPASTGSTTRFAFGPDITFDEMGPVKRIPLVTLQWTIYLGS